MTKTLAVLAADFMVQSLGPGWVADVWENDGWHAAAVLGDPTLCRVIYDPHSVLYTAYAFGAHPDYLGIPPTQATARETVEVIISRMQNYIDAETRHVAALKAAL